MGLDILSYTYIEIGGTTWRVTLEGRFETLVGSWLKCVCFLTSNTAETDIKWTIYYVNVLQASD